MCDRIGVVALSLAVFFAIIAFLPGGSMMAGTLKGYLVVSSVLVALVAWLLGRLIEGSFHLPWSPVIGSLFVSVVVLFLSAVFAKSTYVSFFGENFESGTFAVLGSLMLMTFLVSILFTQSGRLGTFLKTFFSLYVLLAVFQIVHLIIPQFTAFGVFNNRVDTPIGSWSDLAFISGAVLVGATLILQFAKPPRNLKIISFIGAALALFFVILCNILVVWILVGFSSIVILIYTLIINRFSEERQFPFIAFILSLIALLFVLANSLIGGIFAVLFNASFVDVHPSFVATMHVAGQTLRSHPVLGSGPNNFINEWLINRPIAVNGNSLWDTPFASGSSFLTTVAILGGALGILSVIFFLAAFVFEGVKKVFTPTDDHRKQMPIFCIFLVTLYFVMAITLFSPGIAVITCTFFFIGLFIALLVNEKRIPERHVNFLKDQRASFFAILCIVGLLMVSAGMAYYSTERFASEVFFQKALIEAQKGNLDNANNRLSQAIALSDLPSFERTRVLIAEQAIQKTLSTASDSVSPDAVKATLQNAISTGNTAALNSISIDPLNPANYLALGDLLRMVVPLKVDGAFPRAKDVYNQAISLAPNYPKSYLSLAELYFDSSDNKNAMIYAQKAIDLKPNYTDAFFLMSQIEVANGDTDSAIKRLQDATLFDPNNPDTYFELGLIRYQNGSYTDATTAFRSAIVINNQYLNAWYYLALTDQKLGNTNEANTILNALHNRLPNNQAISNSLGVINAPVAAPKVETKTKSSSKQEKAKKLPVPTDATDKLGN